MQEASSPYMHRTKRKSGAGRLPKLYYLLLHRTEREKESGGLPALPVSGRLVELA